MDSAHIYMALRKHYRAKRGATNIEGRFWPRLTYGDSAELFTRLSGLFEQAKPRLVQGAGYASSYAQTIKAWSAELAEGKALHGTRVDEVWMPADKLPVFWDRLSRLLIWLASAESVITRDEAWRWALEDTASGLASAAEDVAGTIRSGANELGESVRATLKTGALILGSAMAAAIVLPSVIRALRERSQ